MMRAEEREGGAKAWLKPVDRRGLLQLKRDETGLMHLQWQDRITSAIDFNKMVFPDEWTFSLVKQVDDGRLIWMKFKQSGNVAKDHFFWLQEPKTDKD